jgi:hypothetical protein
MHHELLSEFSSGWACDNGIVAMSIRAGEPVDPHELLELSSGVKALFSLATLVCRGTDRIADCHRIWTDTLETLRKARTVWADVPINDDPLLLFYLQQLERLCELAAARVDLYTISQSERLAYASRRADTSESAFGSRGDPKEEAQSWTDTRPAHVYSLGRP